MSEETVEMLRRLAKNVHLTLHEDCADGLAELVTEAAEAHEVALKRIETLELRVQEAHCLLLGANPRDAGLPDSLRTVWEKRFQEWQTKCIFFEEES